MTRATPAQNEFMTYPLWRAEASQIGHLGWSLVHLLTGAIPSRRTLIEAPVGKIDFLLSKNCVFYRIAIERGAQYKVYGTLFNILRQVLLIRHPRAACAVSRSIFAHETREASEASRSTAFLTTSTPLLLPHMYVCSSPRT